MRLLFLYPPEKHSFYSKLISLLSKTEDFITEGFPLGGKKNPTFSSGTESPHTILCESESNDDLEDYQLQAEVVNARFAVCIERGLRSHKGEVLELDSNDVKASAQRVQDFCLT